MASSALKLAPGSRVGDYKLLFTVATGGMGSVWAATRAGDPESRLVALKTMLPEIAEDVRFRMLFLDESHVSSRIVHPNVVRVLDVGEDDEILFLVLKWIEGD